MIEIECIIDAVAKQYYIKGTGIHHREDGPAAEYNFSGNKYWMQQGEYHRLDGPAVERNDGTKSWWYYGKFIPVDNQKDFERYIKMIGFE